MTGPAVRVVAPLLLAVALLQAAWFFAVPPFTGIDEIPHAFKAGAVAVGQWQAGRVGSRHGQGGRVRTRADLVAAASVACPRVYAQPYFADNCRPMRPPAADGTVVVDSTAALYDPAWYAVAGTAAVPFRGVHALQAMRLVGAAVCDLLLGWAMWLLARLPSRWPLLAGGCALTPLVPYLSVLAGPDGVQVAGAFLLWAALSVLRVDDTRRGWTAAVAAAGVGGVCVCLTHALGPGWVALVAVLAAGVLGGRRVVAVLGHARVWSCAAVTAVGAAGSAATTWTLVNGTDNPFAAHVFAATPPLTARMVAQATWCWVEQSVAMVPMPFLSGPAPMYAVALTGLVALLAAGGWAADIRTRLVGAAVAALGVGVPVAATVVSYRHVGLAWQGRYTLPLTFGLPFLAGAALARARAASPRRLVTVVSLGWGLVAFQAVAAARGYAAANDLHPLTGTLPLAVACGAAACCAAAALRAHDRQVLVAADGGEP